MNLLPAPVQLVEMSAQQQRGVELEHSLFCCPVCLELLEDPVTLRCGHSYCRSCADGCWDRAMQKGQKYSCPQCRQTVMSRPVLGTNYLLAEVVEKLKETSIHQASSSAPTCAGPADVACDFCCETKPNKATMSCLTCLASYCPDHLEPHRSVPVLKTHQLVSASVPLQDKMCTKHNKLMEIYCETDRTCICYLCTVDEHRRHQIVSVAAKRIEEQKQLTVMQNKVQKRLQDREAELKELFQALKDFKSAVQAAVKSCDDMFHQLISSIKIRSSLTKLLLLARETVAVAEATKLQLKLEEEMAKLRKRDADLQQLAHSDDIGFLQTFPSLSSSCESPDLPPGSVVRPRRSVENVTNFISELRVKVENLVEETWPGICGKVSSIDVVLPPVPKTTQDFRRYSCSLTLDANSINNYLSLSEDNRRVCSETRDMNYSAQAERFRSVRQVLCREGLSGRCYWEVALTGPCWAVAVAYKDVSRSSYSDSEFGKNDKSWSLECSSYCYTFQHNSQSQVVFGPVSSRIGVYLDHRAGSLSFYSVSDKMTLLHRERASFSQPLYPGLGLKAAGYSFSKRCAEVMKIW